jgi:hypothetical protein
MYHSKDDFRPGCGENNAYNGDLRVQWYSTWTSDAWYNEISDPGYNYNDPGFNENPGTGHLTAMIWSSTTKIGCGIQGIYSSCHYCEEKPNILYEFEKFSTRPLDCDPEASFCCQPEFPDCKELYFEKKVEREKA